MPDIHKLAIIANVQQNGTKGGAEVFHQRLYESFSKAVDEVSMIEVPCSENTFEDILRSYQVCYDLDLSGFDGVISSKAPTFAVNHPNHVCYLMHTVRVFYDLFDDIGRDPENVKRRKLIFRLDRELLSPPRTKRVFTIGQEVTDRTEKYIGVRSTVLHPGMTDTGFRSGPYGDYIFMPGRLHRLKRVDLVVRAMKYVTSPVRLVIAGVGEQLSEIQEAAESAANIDCLGWISTEKKKELYSECLAVAFTPVMEDYGYILHEAFKSEKPVITCRDSGEPARFIENSRNGFVCAPDPKAVAKHIDYLYNNKEKAKKMGIYGKKSIEHITWEKVVDTLLSALRED